MIINEKHLAIGLHRSAQAQIADEYKSKGYKVVFEKRIDDYECDVYATKGDEKLAIEIKTSKITGLSKARYLKLAEKLKEKSIRLILVAARMPQPKKISFDDLDEILLTHLQENLPPEIDSMSTHSSVSDICDIDIDSISVSGKKIRITGTAALNIDLQFGSSGDVDNDLGMIDSETANLYFDIELSDLQIEHVRRFDITTDWMNNET